MKRDRYAVYVLCVLIFVYVFNFLDRQILSILAERIKADLGLQDAEIGFLYGTAFAVFYALFGIPLGRVADVSDRRRLIAVGLTIWSLMTAASAFAQTFWQLSLARVGVAVGEASANPAAYSLLSDTFPPERRASVLALYSSGIYIGAGLGLGVGGLIVDRWDAAYATASVAPFGLHGWQVAFLVVGLPGLLLALWVSTLREPPRPVTSAAQTPALRAFFSELQAVLPPFTLFCLGRLGGTRVVVRNLGIAAAIGLGVWGLILLIGTPAQWLALGLGLYSTVSWSQALRLRDPAAYGYIFQNPSLRYASLGFACLAFTGYALGFWAPTFFQRYHHVTASEVGVRLGVNAAVAGWLGVSLGGLWADRWRRTQPLARLSVGQATALLPIPIVIVMLFCDSTTLAYVLNFPAGVATSLWLGPGASTVQDLVPPRFRGTASAAYLLTLTFIGLALGPYTVGQLSVRTGDLRLSMLVFLISSAFALLFFALAKRHLANASPVAEV